jgi:hypothetical protein
MSRWKAPHLTHLADYFFTQHQPVPVGAAALNVYFNCYRQTDSVLTAFSCAPKKKKPAVQRTAGIANGEKLFNKFQINRVSYEEDKAIIQDFMNV